ncbi:MAG: sugar phosphate nucleotidyltransferase [Bacteroidia bacterium]
MNDFRQTKSEEAPSNFVIAGRYVFTADIFSTICVFVPGKNRLEAVTDAMSMMIKEGYYALHFEGKRHDIGNVVDFIKTNLLFGLKRDDMRKDLEEWIKEVAAEL